MISVRAVLYLMLLSLFAACGGGGGGGGESAPPGLDAGVSLSGPWKFTYTTTRVSGPNIAGCPAVGAATNQNVTIVQTGTDLVISADGEPNRTGRLTGRAFSGTTTQTMADLRESTTITVSFAADGTLVSGTGATTVTKISTGAQECVENFNLTGVRDTGGGGTPINVVGTFNGTGTVSASSGGAPCDPVGPAISDDWTLTQNGTSVTWDAGDPESELTGTLTGLSFSGTGTFTKNGVTGMAVRNVTFTADGSSFSGTEVVTATAPTNCTYTRQITGTRGGGGTPINVVGVFNGTGTVSASSGGAPCDPVGPASSDDWTLTQNGTSVTWDAGDPQSELTGTLTGTSFSGTRTGTLGGVTFTWVRNVTFTTCGSSFTGTEVITSTAPTNCTYTRNIMGTRGGQPCCGGLEVKLEWANQADLDLYLQEAGGATVSLNSPSGFGGVFSGDQNCSTGTSALSEKWYYCNPFAGSWIAKPRLYGYCSASSVSTALPFTLTITKSIGTPTVVMGTFPAGAVPGTELPTPFSF